MLRTATGYHVGKDSGAETPRKKRHFLVEQPKNVAQLQFVDLFRTAPSKVPISVMIANLLRGDGT